MQKCRNSLTYFPEGRSHFICESTSNYNHICLTRTGSKNYSKTIHVIPWGSNMHHLYSTACQTKCQRPQGTLGKKLKRVVNKKSSKTSKKNKRSKYRLKIVNFIIQKWNLDINTIIVLKSGDPYLNSLNESIKQSFTQDSLF